MHYMHYMDKLSKRYMVLLHMAMQHMVMIQLGMRPMVLIEQLDWQWHDSLCVHYMRMRMV